MSSNGLKGAPLGDQRPVVVDVEYRLIQMMRLIRLGTASFVYLPIFKWGHIDRPIIALSAALLATVEAVWFDLSLRKADPSVCRAAVLDACFCMVLMVYGSRAVDPVQRNLVMTELIPFSLASSGVVGLSRMSRPWSGGLVSGLMATWVAALYPVLSLKAMSDLLGFVLWLVIARFISTGWRQLAEATDAAQVEAARQQLYVVEIERQRVEAEYREHLHREVHDHLLPVVEYVGAGRPVTQEVVGWARSTAEDARRRLQTRRRGTSELAVGLFNVLAASEAQGLNVESSITARTAPPAAVCEAVVAAAKEALTNVAKHSGVNEAVLSALDLGDGLVVTVRDRGSGFDPETVERGGGMGFSFDAVCRLGGEVTIQSGPSRGTKVAIIWPAPPDRPATEGMACTKDRTHGVSTEIGEAGGAHGE